jgi:hypothetical protein
MTEMDEKNAEDILVIAIETLYDVKLYDWNVLNPINFQMIIMCQFGINFYPESVVLYSWLIKLYGKLGLVKSVNSLSEVFPTAPQSIFEGLSLTRNPADVGGPKKKKGAEPVEETKNLVDQDIEAIGAIRFSLYTDYGFEPDLAELVENYTDYYRDKINDNKNRITKAFHNRDFDIVYPTLQANERVQNAPFQRTISIGQTMCDINANISNVTKIHNIFNKEFKHIETACGNEFDEGFIVEKDPYEIA